MTVEQHFSPPEKPRWSLLDAALVLILMFALVPFSKLVRNVIKLGTVHWGMSAGAEQSLLLFVGTLIQASVIVAGVIVLTRRKGAGFTDLGLGADRITWRNTVKGLTGGVFLGLSIWFMGAVIALIFGPPPPQDVERLLAGVKGYRDLWLPLIAVGVFAPVSEELYFRSMVYPLLRHRFGVLTGMLLSGLFFGALHMDLYRLVPITAGGILLANLYERTRSALVPVVAHSTWNILMLIIFFAAGKYLK